MSLRDERSWMWAEACALMQRAEQLHRQFFNLRGSPAEVPLWEPPADVVERDGELWVQLALPGVAAENVAIQITPSGLLIQAERAPPIPSGRTRVVRLEIPYGRFERRIDLPPGQYVLGERHMDNGCLELRLIRK